MQVKEEIGWQLVARNSSSMDLGIVLAFQKEYHRLILRCTDL